MELDEFKRLLREGRYGHLTRYWRAICPDCRGLSVDCDTCRGTGIVCPGCRGVGWVRSYTGEAKVVRCPICVKGVRLEEYLRTGGDSWRGVASTEEEQQRFRRWLDEEGAAVP